MRGRMNDNQPLPGRIRRGRAVVVGLGLDDAEGHIRYTRGDSFELLGGSEDAHDEMRRRARIIGERIASLGICLERMTYEQYEQVQDIVASVNRE